MKILFMCVANSARSQLAEGLARQVFPNADVRSAGSLPGKLNSYAVAVMREIDINISHHHSKSTDDLAPDFIANLDYIITLCAEEVCPTVIGTKAKRLHWPLPDPAASQEVYREPITLARFRAARDSIKAQLFKLEAQLQG